MLEKAFTQLFSLTNIQVLDISGQLRALLEFSFNTYSKVFSSYFVINSAFIAELVICTELLSML